MTVDDHTRKTPPAGEPGQASPPPIVVYGKGNRRRHLHIRPRRPRRPKLRKLRLLVVSIAFVLIAGIAMLFGVLTSVASDLPQISNAVQFHKDVDSVLYDSTGKAIGVLAPPDAQVIDRFGQISPNAVHAIVSVEDKDFWTDPGIDLKSVARAFLSDVAGGPKEGASTIAEEFVKNALAEQDNRTVLEKLREAGMAFQLVHRWRRPKLLDQYLNIIYFGNGAYGIESAARIYFGKQLGYDASNPSAGTCGTATVADPKLPECASLLRPYQAALLAAMVANPTEFDPILHPTAALQRRNQVALLDMYEQHYITYAQFQKAKSQPLPTAADIQQASEPAAAPYFTSWVRPQIINALEREGVPAKDAPYEAYYGGLKIKLTLNLQMQQAAQDAVDAEFPPGSDGPTATLVSIDNANGEVRAMVSGSGDYESDPFNLATLGYRQPGSAFKVFTLVQALESGKYGPDSIIDSHPLDIPFTGPHGEPEHFIVHNDGNVYSGPITLATATDYSDNTVFAQVGMSLGTQSIARQAHLLGIRSPVSTNPAMIIGGLNHGVSALDMAHAYETLATGGRKVYNPVLGDVHEGAVGIHSISNCRRYCRTTDIANSAKDGLTTQQVVPAEDAATIHTLLAGVVAKGTGTAAAIPGVEVVGKTGTTSSYVDAWFCGWTSELTTCVWVGYPNSGKPMLTNWQGGPVSGGTFPALIWRNYTESALNILSTESAGSTSTGASTTPEDAVTGADAVPDSTVAPTTGDGATTPAGVGAAGTGATAGAGTAGDAATTPAAGTGDGGSAATPATTPATVAPVAPVQSTPAAPAPTAPPASGSGGGSSGTGGAGLGGG
jgi:penicillin-binding protein 1A